MHSVHRRAQSYWRAPRHRPHGLIIEQGRENARRFVANALWAAIGFAVTLVAIGNGLFLVIGQS